MPWTLATASSLTFSDTQITLTLRTEVGQLFFINRKRFPILTLLTGPEFTDVTIDPSSTAGFADGALFDFDADGLTLNIAASCAGPGMP